MGKGGGGGGGSVNLQKRLQEVMMVFSAPLSSCCHSHSCLLCLPLGARGYCGGPRLGVNLHFPPWRQVLGGS